LYYDQAKDLLNEEWGAMKGYLRIEKGEIQWAYDAEDPEEDLIVRRLQSVYLLTNDKGKVLENSNTYQELGFDRADEIKAALKSPSQANWKIKYGKDGTPYLIRSGVFVDDLPHRQFYVAIGRSLGERDMIVREFTWNYFLFVPVMILGSALLGWVISGRAIAPVNDVARTAQRITSSNLSTQIPTRGADDELDRLVRSFNRMTQRLNESFIQTRQFSTDVSHELRTPLTAIRGQLEVAMFTATNVEQYRDAIVDALQDVERLSQTIRALLLLSQAESGQLTLQKQTVDFGALVEDIVDQFQIPADDAKVKLTYQPAEPCLLEGDRIQLERLVSNLLSNAVKYTPAGGRVTVDVHCVEEKVQFIVSDTGKGIPPDHLPHIFDRFYRVPDRNPERGLGLGLSFVAWIVKVHKGKINVDSKLGEGTTFTVSLPVGNVAPPPEPATPPALPEGAERT
jgi:heavy metal sensor kinase